MSDIKNSYMSGVCNIGAAERRARRGAGWLGLVLTVVLWALFLVFRIAAPWRFFIFIPAMLGATGFIQARMSFCVNFGMRGVQNFGDQVGKVTVIEGIEEKRRDRARSWQIVGYSFAIGAVLSVVAFFVG